MRPFAPISLLLVVLSAPAWADDQVKIKAMKVDMWGDQDDIETTKPAVKVVDREARLSVWVNKIEGGTVSKKEKRQDTGRGTIKIKDTYLVQPAWPSPEATSHTVTVRFSHVGHRGGRVPQMGTMRFTFKR